jgi:hypothetical protein
VLIFLIAIVLVAVAVALALHHLFEGEWLLRDLWREARLRRVPLAVLDRRWAAAARSDVVVSLTTIPSRIRMIDLTLKGLLDQDRPPARIVLNLPHHSQREGCAYTVPPHLAALASVEIRRGEDLGPATKMIPTLQAAAPDQPVLVVDDDRLHPRWLVGHMEAAARRWPDCALTLAGWEVPDDLTDRPTTILSNLLMRPPAPVRAHRLRRPHAVDVMQGVMGYLVRPRFFDLDRLADFAPDPPAARLVDDVRSSALCRVPKLVIPAPSLGCLPKRDYARFKATALANLNRGDGRPETRNNTLALRHFRASWRCAQDART